MNIILIALTDPVVNSDDSSNAVTFYEIYFRYLEYHTLILALILIYNDRNIEEDVQCGFFTTSAIIGKYDSFKFSCILIFAHYYFSLVNGFAYSYK
jgi:1,4-dihydroxy-2-naphthoate octaprenyltransferase